MVSPRTSLAALLIGLVAGCAGNESPTPQGRASDGGAGDGGTPDGGTPDGGGAPDGGTPDGGGAGDGGTPDGGGAPDAGIRDAGISDGGPVTCTWTLENPPVSPPGRNHHMMAYDSFNRVTVMFGGLTGTSPSTAPGTFRKDVWHWNSSTWAQKANFPRTIGRSAFAYDSHRRVFVSNGGNRDPIEGIAEPTIGETWEYDAVADTWTQKSVGSGPPQRHLHAMTYDSVRRVMVLTAEGDKGAPSLVWEYNGATSTWTQKPAPPFVSRNRHAMVFDGTRTLLYAGKLEHSQVGPDLSDTWSYDGSTWTEIAGAGGIPRSRHTMVWDWGIRRAIAAYGTSSTVVANDVSTFNAVRWQPTVHDPPTRNYSAMAYQDHLGSSVLFGGISLGDTWTLRCSGP